MKSTLRTPGRPVKQYKRTNSNEGPTDPVQVYCRIRPLQSDADLSCVRVQNSTTVILTPPEIAVNYKINVQRETQYIFKNVFEATASQREVYASVAEPLVENLIKGKNGLLFTYGVTGSGKTYTMTGDKRNRGIMPRCLDSLFKTISDYQAKKFVFKPDKLNGFEILSDADALLERQAEMNSRFAKPRRQDSDHEIASQASTDPKSLNGIDEDNMYAVFVTYIEIYNNSVYDLLEVGPIQKTLQRKIIREDANHNMYTHGVTEIEIKSVEEALETFQTGQKRKRMGHTILNAESSRSHCVFTLRLVQAPTDSQGEMVIQDKRVITVSQLSLVDLAGSERTNRAKNTGQRLREAGNINNSLMTLRTCLEYLRENQLTGSNKKIPYRDSKVTHLFKNYFDGEGQVSMVVCINPRAEDYDETSQVMKFAEMTQEVQVARPIAAKYEIGLTPGRRKANKIFNSAVKALYERGEEDALKLDIDLGLVFSLAPDFPKIQPDTTDSEKLITELIPFLENRIEKRRILQENLEMRCNNCRKHLMQLEKEKKSSKTDIASLTAILQQERKKDIAVENKMMIYENSIDELNRKLRDRDRVIKELQLKLSEKTLLLNQKEIEKRKQKKVFASKMAVETDKMSRELEIKLRKQKMKMEEEMRAKDEKLRLVSDIIQGNDFDQGFGLARSASSDDLVTVNKMNIQEIPETPKPATLYHTPRPLKGIPVANIRHRRSKSAGERWLEHRAPSPVPVGTILQPYLKNRKSITKLTDAKDITNTKTSKYCLIAQEADTDGELETKLYKGNVIPTCGGGAQVIFDDVECLKQKSPVPSPNRKRPSSPLNTIEGVNLEELNTRCRMSIEGHSVSMKRPKI